MKIEELLSSKTYVRDNGSLTFPSPKELIEPFIENFKNDNIEYKISTNEEIVNKEQDSDILNIAYPKVMIQANYKTDKLKDFESIIGIIYHLNIQRPVMKVFTGLEVSACLNLTIFNALNVFQQDLLGSYKECYNKVKTYIAERDVMIDEYINIYNDLVDTKLTNTELKELIGDLLFKSVKNNMTNVITKGVKALSDPISAYYIGQGVDYNCSKWNVLQSFTAAVSKTDISEKPVKVLNIAKMMKIC